MILDNVKATVVDNVNAPLLLGQTVLERFGKIEIDNGNNEIIFK
jgi:aspartyl protease family protein